MNYYGQLRREALKRGMPAAQVDKFADHLRFAVWLSIRDDCGGDVVGQRGGLPRLPVGTQWPSNGEYPLPFIASLDCAALPKIEKLPLPVDGSLLLFVDTAFEDLFNGYDDDYVRILYVPAGTETAVATQSSSGPDIPAPGPERRLFAMVEPQLPNWLDPDEEDDDPLECASDIARQLAGELTQAEELIALVHELWPAKIGLGRLCVGGYTWDIGGSDSPERQIASERLDVRLKTGLGIPPSDTWDWLEEEEFRVTQEWVPLVQCDTDSDFYYGRYLISFDDLAACRFDKIRSFPGLTE